MEKVDSQPEVQVEQVNPVETRRCVCPVCRSRDVWKWGKPTLTDRLVRSFSGKTALRCRRCGHKFRRKVVFGDVG